MAPKSNNKEQPTRRPYYGDLKLLEKKKAKKQAKLQAKLAACATTTTTNTIAAPDRAPLQAAPTNISASGKELFCTFCGLQSGVPCRIWQLLACSTHHGAWHKTACRALRMPQVLLCFFHLTQCYRMCFTCRNGAIGSTFRRHRWHSKGPAQPAFCRGWGCNRYTLRCTPVITGVLHAPKPAPPLPADATAQVEPAPTPAAPLADTSPPLAGKPLLIELLRSQGAA